MNKILTTICLLLLIGQPPEQESEQRLKEIERGHVLAWARHKTGIDQDDEFESIAIIPGANSENEIWCVVKRTINGSTVRWVEQFQPVDFGDQNDAWFVDAGIGDVNSYGVAEQERAGDYTEYLVGFTRGAYGNVVVKAKSDSTINTDWGTDGFWGFVGEEFGGTISCYTLHQLSDGRMLVGHNNYWIEGQSYGEGGKLVSVTMLTADGEIDTSWGYNGRFCFDGSSVYPYLNIIEILEDLQGNFYFIGQCNFGTITGYHKVDAGGNELVYRNWNTSPKIIMVPRGALWYDAARTQILVYGGHGNYPSGTYYANCVLLSTADFEPVQNGSWGGLGHKATDGYANITNEYNPVLNLPIVKDIIKLSDGNYVAKHGYSTDPDYRTLSKFAYDGKSYLSSWGGSGHVGAGSGTQINTLCEIGTNVYSISEQTPNSDICYFTEWDVDGNLTDSHTVEVVLPPDMAYHFLKTFNEYLILGSRDYYIYWPERIERWTTDFEKVDGFSIPGLTASHYIKAMIPDEITRETDYVYGVDVNHVEVAHLAGAEVCVYADGTPIGNYTVFADANGTNVIDLNDTYDTVIAGINYYSVYESPLLATKNTMIKNATIDFYETLGCHVGVDQTYSADWKFSYDDFATRAEMFSGYKHAPWLRGTTLDPRVYLWHWNPTPLTVRGVYLQMEVTNE